jgi:predicted transposase/invertase (TIGR01784 family)
MTKGKAKNGKSNVKETTKGKNGKRKNEQATATANVDGQNTILALKYDVIFAIFFSNKRNEEDLVGLLKAILKLPDDEYELLDVSDPRLHPDYVGKKHAVIDVKLKTKSGRVIHIEMQLEVRPEFMNRVVFYNAKLVADQLESGDDYGEIQQTITIIITGERFVKDGERYHHRFVYHDKDAGVDLTDLTEIHTVELCKLPPKPDGTALYDWAKLIAAETEAEMDAIVKRNPKMKRTVAKLRVLSADEDARDLLERRKKGYRDFVSAVASETARYKAQIAEKDAEIADKDSAIADKDALIAELQAKLNEK